MYREIAVIPVPLGSRHLLSEQTQKLIFTVSISSEARQGFGMSRRNRKGGYFVEL